MGVSLTILKVKNIDLDRHIAEAGGVLIVPPQKNLHAWGSGDNLPAPTSEIRKSSENQKVVRYDVKHHSETRKNQVRAFFNVYAPVISYADAYQETTYFKMVYNFEQKELYLFATDAVCKTFLTRMDEVKQSFDVEHVKFNLYKVATSAALENVGGIWSKNPAGGRVKARAIQLVHEAAQKYFKGDAQTLKKLQVTENSLSQNTKYVIQKGMDITAIISDTAGITPIERKK